MMSWYRNITSAYTTAFPQSADKTRPTQALARPPSGHLRVKSKFARPGPCDSGRRSEVTLRRLEVTQLRECALAFLLSITGTVIA
jgi:hypothetical protein